jgi:hypothetical protein
MEKETLKNKKKVPWLIDDYRTIKPDRNSRYLYVNNVSLTLSNNLSFK